MSSPFPADRIQLDEVARKPTAARTLVAEGGVPDEVWNGARAGFGESELASMVFAITAINAWNRLMIAARVQPGHYQAGMLEAAA